MGPFSFSGLRRFDRRGADVLFPYLRLTRRLTQHHLAAMTHINQSHISLMEQGRLTPTEAQLDDMAMALGISPARVLMRTVVIEPAEIREQLEAKA